MNYSPHSCADSDPDGVISRRLIHLMIQFALRRDRITTDILRPYKISVTQWRVLFYVGRRSSASMAELAEYVVLDRTSLTRAVDKLVATGLVDRSEPAHDRRMVIITLTEKGAQLRRTLVDLVVDHAERLSDGLDADDLQRTTKVVEIMLERLVGHRAGARRVIELI